MMDLIADILIGLGALGAASYCIVLSRRLRRFNNLQNGMGGAVAVLSAQVDDMTRTLETARKAAGESADTLGELTGRAEAAAKKLELMLASLHDLPQSGTKAGHQARSQAANTPASEDRRQAPSFLFSSKRKTELVG